ncbi:MAG TPA: Gx transporter family protein [Candidatus Cloacimonetes bacterium]|nr:Gx transporter family protein [Candidatus Cloacimonadota bacterium]
MEITGISHPATRLAFFTAFAITIYVVENFIPKPLPFMKFGLANIVILILLFVYNFKNAFIVAVSKTLIGGFFSGTLLSPTTILSLSGSICSLLVMFLFLKTKINFSIIGISILGAVFHNLAQISIVRFLLIKEDSIFYLAPILILMGIITGIITGFLAHLFINRIEFLGKI